MEKEFLSMCHKVRQDLVDYYTGLPYPKRAHELHLLQNGRWRFFDEEFAGACGVAAYMLTILARQKKMPIVLAGHESHFFCYDTNTGNIIDPTFEQFDSRNPVWVGKPRRWHNYSFKDNEGFAKGEAAKMILVKFPPPQNPFSSYHRRTLERWMNAND